MAKQKKNSNYVTDKNIAKKEALEEQKQKKERAKTLKTVAIISGAVVGFLAVLFAVLLACGVFKYYPEATLDANITFSDGTVLHYNLYGNDAPKTVDHFKSLINKGYFRNMPAHTFLNGMLYFDSSNANSGKPVITGEFQSDGFKNKVKAGEGVICLAKDPGKDSGYGHFFIVTENSPKIEGDYTVFGKITDMAALDKLIDSIKVDKDGKVIDAPTIVSISTHVPETESGHEGHNH